MTPSQSPARLSVEELSAAARDRDWYHTLEIAPGVVTAGWFDTRRALDDVPLPASLEGKRCLDVGTFDGFWAFEMERRGAAEVVAVDIIDPARWDWPAGSESAVMDAIAVRKGTGDGFLIAADALGSRVRRHAISVYDLDPKEVGTFDFVYVGSLLLHLRDPVRALERVRTVCSGRALMVDAIDLELTLLHPRRPVAGLDARGRPWWWKPNVAGLVRMIEAAGMRPVQPAHRFYMPLGAGQAVRRPPLRRLRGRLGREQAVTAWRGDPHCAVLAEPVVL